MLQATFTHMATPVPIPDPHGTTMRFVSSMSAPRTKPEDKRNNIMEWTLADAERARSKHKNLCEFLSADRPWTKPFFDTESYHPTQPIDEAIHAILERCLVSVDKVMQDQPGYARSDVRVGQRHGIDPKHGSYKVSFRMWVTGFKVQYPQLRDLVDLKGVGGDGEGLLDKSVYKAPEQLLNCMGCCKGSLRAAKGVQKVDKRLLKATDHDEPWSTYLVQHLRGDERPMIMPAVQAVASPSPTRPHTLDVFLKAHKVKSGAPHRFTSAAKPFGSYWVPEAHMPTFYDLYTSDLEAGKPLSLTERQGPEGPVVVDIDLCFPRDPKARRRYTSDTVLAVAMAYQHNLKAHTTLADDQLLCYVLERASPYQNEKHTKDGFHLVFPHARAAKALKVTLREEAIARCKVTLQALGSQRSPEEIVDGKVLNWYVYGSGKPTIPPYKLTRVLGADGKVVPVTHTLPDLVKLLRVSEQGDDILTGLGALTVSDQALEATRQSPGALNQTPDDAAVEEVSFELLDRVVMGLSVSRADAPEPDWIQVVWPIMNVSTDNKYLRMGRDLVHRFSKQAPDRYDEEQVEAKLNTLNTRQPAQLRKQFGSLRHMLQADNAELYGELFELSEIREYKEVKAEFEKKHFKLMTPAAYGRVDDHGVFQLRSHSDLVHHMRDVFCIVRKTGRDKVVRPTKTSFFEVWLKDASKRTYERVDMLPPPLVCPSDVYNTYQGLRAERLPPLSEPRSVQIILDHVLMLAGDTGEAGREYLLDYMAHLVQKPGVLPKVGILMQSKQGVGKNLLFEELLGKKILGPGLMHCSAQSEDYFGRFDNAAVNKLLCIHDEVVGRDMARTAGLIKESITAELQGLEEKGLKKVQLRNFVRWIYLTQSIHALLLDTPERRVFVAECNNSMAPGVGAPEVVDEYFTRLWTWVADDANVRAFYDYLMARDISTWRPVLDRPNSRYYTELQRMSLGRVDEWLIDMLENNTLPTSAQAQPLRLRFIASVNLTRQGGAPFDMKAFRFKKELDPYIDSGAIVRDDSNPCIEYRFDRFLLHDTLVRMNKMDRMRVLV